jgi:hypothetical protein
VEALYVLERVIDNIDIYCKGLTTLSVQQADLVNNMVAENLNKTSCAKKMLLVALLVLMGYMIPLINII